MTQRRSLFFFCLLLALAGPALAQVRIGGNDQIDLNYLQPKTYEIGGITVSGAQFLDPTSLINITGLQVGEEVNVPGEKLASAIRKLWDQGILGDIELNITRIEGKYIFLDFALRERPRLSKFTFKGTRKGETDDLRDKIQLIRGRVVTDALVKNTQNIVRKHFIEKGYLNCTVNVRQVQDSILNNSVALRIDVNKGSRVKVRYIAFEGNTYFTDEKLRRKMKDTKEKRFWRLFKASRFVRSKYEADRNALVAAYNKEGFRDAEIAEDTVVRLDNKHVGILLTLNEGNRYYYRNITWTGNYLYDSKTLSTILAVNKGDVYDREALERRLQINPNGADVSSLYMDDGYLFFSVDPVEVAIDKDSIDIEMRVYEGPQATINRINIAGNTKTNDHVILREIRTLPGTKFNRSELIRTQRELSQLGYFDPEQIGIQPMPNPQDGTVDINYSVVERPSDQVELSGGWGGAFGFVGTLGLTFNNFSARKFTDWASWSPLPAGDGQRLSLRAQANGRQFQTYSFSFTEPWLGGRRPNSFTVGVSHSVQRTFSSSYNSYAGRNIGPGTLQVTGLNVSLGRRLSKPDDYFTLLNTVSWQRYLLDEFQFSPTFYSGTANNLSFVTTLARNSVNNPIFPTSGSNISLSLALTPPYSLFRDTRSFTTDEQRYKLIEYNKWMFDASWFTPLASKLVINTRAHFGFIGTYSKNQAVGPFERFRVGGDGITGFNFLLGYDIIGLRGYPNVSIKPPGEDAGTIYNKYVTELRYAVTTNPAATVYGLAFAEGGNNWGRFQDFSPFNIYRSVGVGVRIFMPAFGLLGFDYGWGLDHKTLGTNRGQFHFTIGQQIR